MKLLLLLLLLLPPFFVRTLLHLASEVGPAQGERSRLDVKETKPKPSTLNPKP